MTDKPIQTGPVPYPIVEAGLFHLLTSSELHAYVLICGHANGKTLEASPGVERIARLMRRSNRTAERAIKGLAVKGFIQISRGGGRGLTNRYVLEGNPDNMGVTVSGQETPSNRPPKPRQKRSETPSNLSQNPDTQGVAPTDEQFEHHQNTAVVVGATRVGGGDAGADPRVIDALTLAGIAEPTRSRLAALPGITAELVKRVVERTKATGGGTGAIVRAIETEIEAQEVRQRHEQERQQAAAQRGEPTEEQLRDYIGSLSEEDLKREKLAALEELNPADRDFVGRFGVHEHRTLRILIWKRRRNNGTIKA